MNVLNLAPAPLSLALLISTATVASADTTCTARSIAGDWLINYTLPIAEYVDSSGGFVPPALYMNFCDVTINRRGRVAGECYNSGTDRTWTFAGRATVDRQCVLRIAYTSGSSDIEAVARVGSTVGTTPSFFTGYTARPAQTALNYRLTNFEGTRRPDGLPSIDPVAGAVQSATSGSDGAALDGPAQ